MSPKSIIEVPEDGIITDAMRLRLKQKRIELGLSMKRVAAELELNWATIRKWENGQGVRCSISNRRRFERFLNGEYDHLFQDKRLQSKPAASKAQAEIAEASSSVYKVAGAGTNLPVFLTRIAAIYDLCATNPKLQAEMERQFGLLTDTYLSKLAQGSRSSESKK
jgi:DNA-binding XRE family transcriptional regulator